MTVILGILHVVRKSSKWRSEISLQTWRSFQHALRSEKSEPRTTEQQNGAERNGTLVRCWRGIKWLSGPMIYTTLLFSARVRFPVKWQCIWRPYKTILFFSYTSRQNPFREVLLQLALLRQILGEHFHCWWWNSVRYTSQSVWVIRLKNVSLNVEPLNIN